MKILSFKNPVDVAVWTAHPDLVVRIDRQSKWGNPFIIGRDGTRTEVCAKYDKWLDTQPDLLAALPELTGMLLICHCAPRQCHGEILWRRLTEYHYGKQKK